MSINALLTRDYGQYLRQRIIEAKRLIWISNYVTVLNQKRKSDMVFIIFNLLRCKAEAGLDVRLVIDSPRKHATNYHAVKRLIRRATEWKIDLWIVPEKRTCHAKLILIDDELSICGSHNLARSSLTNEYEASIASYHEGIVSQTRYWFDRVFSNPQSTHYPPGLYEWPDIYP